MSVIFGERVRTLRKARGLSQKQISIITRLDRSYIGGVERGERNVSLYNIFKIATALDIKLDELFKDFDV
ncbi:XRE family transcriptional regulator [Marinobacter orientalis]|uniref:Helix-turn-helix transcriptional regulator n=1 Tax=Marinobacter orientalis TaxID=1928859 RepID=A0A7Y0RC05_9GAMM|nr:helix-turn-helix transcriptional regulator [Marinobacter orientalis]TGX48653.1 XRE family transcriptional regulator [Marinobacter orientalis]